MEEEFLNTALKTMFPAMFHLMALMVAGAGIKAMLSLLIQSSNQKSNVIDIDKKKTKVRKTSLKEEMERIENLKELGFENKLEIKVHNPQRESVWIEDFSVDYDSSSLTIKDNKGRAYCCSINNIEKIKVTNLESGKAEINDFISYSPTDEFWLPKNSDSNEIEQDGDWCDF